MTRMRSVVRVCLLAALMLVGWNRVAFAEHFQGGTVSWQQDLTYLDPVNVKVSVAFSGAFLWSHSFGGVGTNPPVGTVILSEVFLQLDGTSFSTSFFLPVVVQAVFPTEDLLVANGVANVIIPKTSLPVSVVFASCCRDLTLAEGNGNQSYKLRTVIDLNGVNGATRSPTTTALARIRLPLGATSALTLPSTAYEGFTNRFSFTPTESSFLVTPRPNGTPPCATGTCTDLFSTSGPYASSMQLTPGGQITWTPQLAGLYAAQFTITSVDAFAVPRASIPLDVEFEVLTLCDPGNYSATGEPPCTQAPAGSFASGYGSTSAVLCAPGTFSSAAGAASCTLAPLGYYVDTAGSISATACPAGTFSDVTGAVACTLAPIGYYVSAPGSSAPTACGPGTYSDVTGAVACTLAPAGSYASGTGNTHATLCPAGTFSDTVGAAACTQAPIGYYVATAGSTSATACPAGTFSDVTGAVACTLAPIGYYVSAPGSSSPTACPPGTYSDVTGAVACTLAPAGSYASGTGNTHATLCPAGSYSSTAGSSSCTLAPLGYFVGTAGSTAATACAAGTFSDTVGATSCTPCPTGTSSGVGASACTTQAALLDQAIDAYLGDTGLAHSLHQQVASILSAPNANAKAGKLAAFINHVNALRGTVLTSAQADYLIYYAQLL